MSADDLLASPEPMVRRAALSLDGLWDFAFEGPAARLTGDGPSGPFARKLAEPIPKPSQRDRNGALPATDRYSDDWAGRSIVLVMEGVFHETTVLVDGAPVATHGDGWTTIEVDLTGALAEKRTFVLGIDTRIPDDARAPARVSVSR